MVSTLCPRYPNPLPLFLQDPQQKSLTLGPLGYLVTLMSFQVLGNLRDWGRGREDTSSGGRQAGLRISHPSTVPRAGTPLTQSQQLQLFVSDLDGKGTGEGAGNRASVCTLVPPRIKYGSRGQSPRAGLMPGARSVRHSLSVFPPQSSEMMPTVQVARRGHEHSPHTPSGASPTLLCTGRGRGSG